MALGVMVFVWDLVVLGYWLDSVILKVFSNLNDCSVIIGLGWGSQS